MIQKRKLYKENDSILQARYNIKPLSVCLTKLDNLDVPEYRKDFKYAAVVQKEKVQGKILILKENLILLEKYKIKPFAIVLKKLDDQDVQRITNNCKHSAVSQKHFIVHNKEIMQGKLPMIKGNQDDSTLIKKCQIKPSTIHLKKFDNSVVPNNLKQLCQKSM